MISCALKYADKTGGAFNPALGSVIELWDYHSDNPVVPSQSSIDEALKYTDSSVIRLVDRSDNNVNDFTTDTPSNAVYVEQSIHYICLPMDDTIIDLGAIAKGYIADELKDYLMNYGCTEAVITLGGNVYCIGNKGGSGYSVGIQKPFDNKGTAQMAVNVSDSSVVTSGIYERYFEQDGRLYHHIIDSFTGYPTDNELASVTVICSNSMKADVLSTAFLCMGRDNALEFVANDADMRVIMITRDGEVIDTAAK